MLGLTDADLAGLAGVLLGAPTLAAIEAHAEQLFARTVEALEAQLTRFLQEDHRGHVLDDRVEQRFAALARSAAGFQPA